jgi:hypothetical protein
LTSIRLWFQNRPAGRYALGLCASSPFLDEAPSFISLMRNIRYLQ